MTTATATRKPRARAKAKSPMAQARATAIQAVGDGSDTIDVRNLPRENGGVVIDASAIMAQLAALTERVASAEDKNKRLELQIQSAQANGWYMDEFGNKVPCLNSAMQQDNLNNHDKPGTLLEKLDNMEKLARIRKEPFDRERVRRILSGEPVEDEAVICTYCGRSDAAWSADEEKYDAHIEWHRGGGKKAAYPKRKKIRVVDQDDDEEDE